MTKVLKYVVCYIQELYNHFFFSIRLGFEGKEKQLYIVVVVVDLSAKPATYLPLLLNNFQTFGKKQTFKLHTTRV